MADKNSNKKIFVTGADGFIGSHLVEALIREGYNVRALVLYNSFGSMGWLDTVDDEIKKSIEVISGDIRDPFGIKNAMRGCDIVLHLAALIAIPYSYHSPGSYVDTNIYGTLNILQAAREHGISKIVHTSTSEVYGSAQYVPIDEEHPLQAQSPYSASKISAESIALSFYRSFDLPVTILRPFNTYGPRQSARAVIPTIITQIASGKTRLSLGSLYPTRDFNYVADTVNGFIATVKSDRCVGEVINIGSNFEISIGETASIISKLMGVEIEIEQDDNRLRPDKSEVDRLLADNNKASQLFGWKPDYAGKEGLSRGLKETIDWFSKSSNLNYYKTNGYQI